MGAKSEWSSHRHTNQNPKSLHCGLLIRCKTRPEKQQRQKSEEVNKSFILISVRQTTINLETNPYQGQVFSSSLPSTYSNPNSLHCGLPIRCRTRPEKQQRQQLLVPVEQTIPIPSHPIIPEQDQVFSNRPPRHPPLPPRHPHTLRIPPKETGLSHHPALSSLELTYDSRTTSSILRKPHFSKRNK